MRRAGRQYMRTLNISPQMMREKLKYEAAEELGLLDKVLEGGWGALTAEQTGRIGGIVARQMRASTTSPTVLKRD
ncbi:MAG TPA: small, acid-soluble spore protein, alpha/beta type [Candidatus Fimadaptatus faecigallinarum]|uniref:Small, acid-soluble spore protein, alpha/beta type n=1 Tax=Candidatus Fimadaptatus faecigallinarum TaxID=2840814 RepID=A0A9D1S4Z5_9FIRM|nr:small, acid-soluble spore protein, alpha/beta type [Candidatus Fimadaptatus faecigallinarum]